MGGGEAGLVVGEVRCEGVAFGLDGGVVAFVVGELLYQGVAPGVGSGVVAFVVGELLCQGVTLSVGGGELAFMQLDFFGQGVVLGLKRSQFANSLFELVDRVGAIRQFSTHVSVFVARKTFTTAASSCSSEPGTRMV